MTTSPEGERNKVRRNRHERLAVEIPVERERRLQCYSMKYRERSVQPQFPLFQQCSTKIGKLHSNMATLDTAIC